MTVSVRFKDVAVGYGGRIVVEGLSGMLVGPGLFRLAGANGSGKSTLMETLSGHLPTIRGEIHVAGSPSRSRRQDLLVYVRTDPAFLVGVTMRDHCSLALRRVPAAERRLVEALAGFGLESLLDMPARSLSAGSAKKFWLALHFARQARVMCLDEPFNALDGASRAWLRKRLEGLAREQLVIVVSHEIPAAWTEEETLFSAGDVRFSRLLPASGA